MQEDLSVFALSSKRVISPEVMEDGSNVPVTCDSTRHEPDHGDLDEDLCGIGEPFEVGTVRNSVYGRAADYQAIARVKRSPKMTANWALAIAHSLGGMVHSFSALFKTSPDLSLRCGAGRVAAVVEIGGRRNLRVN